MDVKVKTLGERFEINSVFCGNSSLKISCAKKLLQMFQGEFFNQKLNFSLSIEKPALNEFLMFWRMIPQNMYAVT